MEHVFMSIIREVSFEVEKRSGVRPEVIDVVRVLYGDTKGRYETEWGMTEDVPIGVGVGQGCVAAPCRSKLVLSVVQRAVSTLTHGFKFEGASGGTPSLFFADDGACIASSLADLQLMFDTAWMVSRILGLSMGVKANGKKTAYEILSGLVGSEMCIRDRCTASRRERKRRATRHPR